MVVGGVWDSCGRTRGDLRGDYQMLDRGIIRCSRRHFQMVIGN